jgi:predicted naringenin-chalcone synthase
MQLHSLATASPPAVFTQRQCASLAQDERISKRLNRRSQLILRSILSGDSGVETRHFAVSDVGGVFDYSADQLNEAFRKEAPALAARALEDALRKISLGADKIDALFVCTCTGYLCPGLTSYVAEGLGLKADAFLQDIVGQGCAAAIPMLRTAETYLSRNPEATVATVAVEICSAALYLDDDPGVLISACLFGDGAAAAIWRTDQGPLGITCRDFATLHWPKHRDEIRFEQRDGKLRNLLASSVPDLAAEAVATLFAQENVRSGARPISRIAAHPGGRDVINAVEKRLPQFDYAPGRAVLRAHGNMSSPSVLFVLAETLKGDVPKAESDWWLISFGAGFSAHSCRIGRQ